MARELTDATVIQFIREGKIDFFEHLTRTYTKHIYHFVKGRLFEKNDVDDLVQNTFLSFYKALGRFDTSKPVLPYLYQIARNELKMYYRSKKQTVPLETIEHTIDRAEETDSTEVVRSVLTTLTKDQQQALKLVSEGYSYEEISDKMGKPLNTIRTIIRRARLSVAATKQGHEKA